MYFRAVLIHVWTSQPNFVIQIGSYFLVFTVCTTITSDFFGGFSHIHIIYVLQKFYMSDTYLPIMMLWHTYNIVVHRNFFLRMYSNIFVELPLIIQLPHPFFHICIAVNFTWFYSNYQLIFPFKSGDQLKWD